MYREYLKSGVLTEVSFDDNMTCAHCAHCIRKCVSQNNKKKLGGGDRSALLPLTPAHAQSQLTALTSALGRRTS